MQSLRVCTNLDNRATLNLGNYRHILKQSAAFIFRKYKNLILQIARYRNNTGLLKLHSNIN